MDYLVVVLDRAVWALRKVCFFLFRYETRRAEKGRLCYDSSDSDKDDAKDDAKEKKID